MFPVGAAQKQQLLAMRQQKADNKKRQVEQILAQGASGGTLARVAPRALQILGDIKEEHESTRGSLSKKVVTARHGYGVETMWVNRSNRSGGGKLHPTSQLHSVRCLM